MQKYDDKTILVLKCLAKNWGTLDDVDNSKNTINEILSKYDNHAWYEFYFFSLNFLRTYESVTAYFMDKFGCDKSKNSSPKPDIGVENTALINALNQLLMHNINKGIIVLNQADKESIDVGFLVEDASLVHFMWKLYSKNDKSHFMDFGLEKLFDNIFIPLYHNRNFQFYLMMYLMVAIFALTPFAPHLALGLVSAIVAAYITMAIIQCAMFLIYKALDVSSTPISRTISQPQNQFIPPPLTIRDFFRDHLFSLLTGEV